MTDNTTKKWTKAQVIAAIVVAFCTVIGTLYLVLRSHGCFEREEILDATSLDMSPGPSDVFNHIDQVITLDPEAFIKEKWNPFINKNYVEQYKNLLDIDFYASFQRINRPAEPYNREEWTNENKFYLRKGINIRILNITKEPKINGFEILRTNIRWRSQRYCMNVTLKLKLQQVERDC